MLAKDQFEALYPDDPVAATQAFARFMGFFGQAANGLTFAFSVVGTSFVIRRLGLPKTLVLFPSMLIIVCFAILSVPSLEVRKFFLSPSSRQSISTLIRTITPRCPPSCFYPYSSLPALPPATIAANQTVFVAMLLLKALSYALNNPCKEMLYQPTTKAVKFKAKSWIDIFGQRGAKVRPSVHTFPFSFRLSYLPLSFPASRSC